MYRFRRENWARKVNGTYPKTWTSTGKDYGFFLDRKRHAVHSQYAETHPESDYPALYTASRPISAVRRSVGDSPRTHLTRRKRIRAGEDYFVQPRRRATSWNTSTSYNSLARDGRTLMRPRSTSLTSTSRVRQVNEHTMSDPGYKSHKWMTSHNYLRSPSLPRRIVEHPPPVLTQYEVHRSARSPSPLTMAYLKHYHTSPSQKFQPRSLSPHVQSFHHHSYSYAPEQNYRTSFLQPSLHEDYRNEYDVVYPRRDYMYTRSLSPLNHRKPLLRFAERRVNETDYSPKFDHSLSQRTSTYHPPRPPTPHSKSELPGYIPHSTYRRPVCRIIPSSFGGGDVSRAYGHTRLPPLTRDGYPDTESRYHQRRDVAYNRQPYINFYDEEPVQEQYRTHRLSGDHYYQQRGNYSHVPADIPTSPSTSHHLLSTDRRHSTRSPPTVARKSPPPVKDLGYVEYRRANDVSRPDVEPRPRPLPVRRRIKEIGINQRFFDVRNRYHNDTWRLPNSFGRNN